MKRMMVKMSSSGNNNTSYIYIITLVYPMQKPAVEYRKIQKHSSGDTLLVTIPYDFAKAIPLKKSDTVRMVLNSDNKIVVQRVAD